MNQDREWLTPEQAAETLQIRVETIRKYITQGKIKAVKVGRVWRIRREEWERFLKDLEEVEA